MILSYCPAVYMTIVKACKGSSKIWNKHDVTRPSVHAGEKCCCLFSALCTYSCISICLSFQCAEMLDFLGIPWVSAAGEAEAMCAFMDAQGLVDGCITSDGDAFLYGAQTVYRNFNMNTKVLSLYTIVESLWNTCVSEISWWPLTNNSAAFNLSNVARLDF